MLTLRTLVLPASLALGLACAGCEPGSGSNNSGGKPVSTTTQPELGSCCDEPTPTLADLRKNAAKTDPAVEVPSKVNATPKEKEKETPGISAPKDRDALGLDFNFTDQDGKPFNLASIKGKPTVATFIFTRCPNPQMCPLQGAKMAALQKSLEKDSLSEKVNLLVFTFDPDYDTPERLKTWGQTQGIAFTNAKMLRPEPREFTDFKYEFQFRAFPTATGELTHKTDLMLIDKDGKLAAFYGGMWDDANVRGEVLKLIAEK